jgi:hypothetical protein
MQFMTLIRLSNGQKRKLLLPAFVFQKQSAISCAHTYLFMILIFFRVDILFRIFESIKYIFVSLLLYVSRVGKGRFLSSDIERNRTSI